MTTFSLAVLATTSDAALETDDRASLIAAPLAAVAVLSAPAFCAREMIPQCLFIPRTLSTERMREFVAK